MLALSGAVQAAEPHRAAQPQVPCPSLVVGTYLITLEDESGALTSRSLVTFFANGNLSSVDSLQQSPDQSFGDSLGTWACTGPNTIAATALNFNHDSGEPGIVRVDYEAEFDQSKRIEGTVGFRFFGIRDNPLRRRSPDIDTMTFSGSFVPAYVR